MKKLILFSIAGLVAGFANAQQLNPSQVPSPVKASFHERFPKAIEIQWSRKNKDEFGSEFQSDGKKMSASFGLAGVWRSTETVIKSTDLSKAIRATIAKQFVGYKLTKSTKVEPAGKAFVYETELEKGKAAVAVTFSFDGKIITKEEKKSQ